MSMFLKFFRKDYNVEQEEDKKNKKKKGKCKCKCLSKKRCCGDSTVSDGSSGSSPLNRDSIKIESRKGPVTPSKSYMPVSKNNPDYNMNHVKRGKALIFNFDRWENTNIPHLEENPRHGSQKDKKDLAKCLKRMDFDVEEFDNLKYKEMDKVLQRVQYEDHSESDCLVVAVMTHGEKNTVYCGDGVQIPVNIIWEFFEANNCPTLAGKPKIFIIQACRGKQYDNGTMLHFQQIKEALIETGISDVTDSGNFSYVIPNAADIIVAFSCPLGHFSWRHPERGSWFIQAICKVFTKHCYDMDLQMLFTTVAREVALNHKSNTTNIESNNKRQVTSTSSTLIRTVKFKPKMDLPPVGAFEENNGGGGGGSTLPISIPVLSSRLIPPQEVFTTTEIITAEISNQNLIAVIEDRIGSVEVSCASQVKSLEEDLLAQNIL